MGNVAVITGTTATFPIVVRTDLVDGVEVGVVVAVGEVPVEERGHARLGERGVIAAALVGVGAHHPARCRGRGAARRRGAGRSRSCHCRSARVDLARAPLGVRVRRPRPHRGRIGPFSMRNVPPVLAVSSPVMSSDIIARTPATGAGSAASDRRRWPGSRRPKSTSACAPAAGIAPSAIAYCIARAGGASSVPLAAGVVVGPGLLHVRRPAPRDRRATRVPGNSGNQRAHRPAMEHGVGRDVHLHRPGGQRARAGGGRPAASP